MTPRPERTNPTPHDPYECAETLGIKVIHRPIQTATGMWVPEHNLIVIRTGMRRVHDRSTLAHELAHAHHGHHESTARNEAVADRTAALAIIDGDVFAHAIKYAHSIEEVAAECDVSTKLARAYAAARGLTVAPLLLEA